MFLKSEILTKEWKVRCWNADASQGRKKERASPAAWNALRELASSLPLYRTPHLSSLLTSSKPWSILSRSPQFLIHWENGASHQEPLNLGLPWNQSLPMFCSLLSPGSTPAAILLVHGIFPLLGLCSPGTSCLTLFNLLPSSGFCLFALNSQSLS